MCFFMDLFPCFLNGTNLSVMPSIPYFKQVQHYAAVLFFSKLFQSIFPKYVLISLYLPLLKFLLLYVKKSIQAYKIKLEREADCDEAVWCKIVSRNSKLIIGLVYRIPNINKEDNTKIQNAIKEVNKWECITMGYFNHGHI